MNQNSDFSFKVIGLCITELLEVEKCFFGIYNRGAVGKLSDKPIMTSLLLSFSPEVQ